MPRVEVADDPSQLRAADAVLVAVKSWQVAEIAPRLAPLVAADGFVVPLENGVDAAPTLVRALGEARVAGGFCAMLAWLERPGLIRHAGEVLRVVVGERSGGGSPRLLRLVERMNSAHIDASIAPDIEAALWEKFVFIAAFGGVAAASRAPAQAVRTTPETRALLTAAMEEIAQLARARGVRLDQAAVRNSLAIVDALPPQATASMQRDIQAGRPSELQDQLGAIVRLAAESGVTTPACTSLFAVLLPQELAARG